MTDLKQVIIYTDGSCSGNPGPGGWAAILRFGQHEKIVSGADPQTTNNRMELTAALEALRALKEPVTAKLHTDSAYLERAFNDGWLTNWQKNGWQKNFRSGLAYTQSFYLQSFYLQSFYLQSFYLQFPAG